MPLLCQSCTPKQIDLQAFFVTTAALLCQRVIHPQPLGLQPLGVLIRQTTRAHVTYTKYILEVLGLIPNLSAFSYM